MQIIELKIKCKMFCLVHKPLDLIFSLKLLVSHKCKITMNLSELSISSFY